MKILLIEDDRRSHTVIIKSLKEYHRVNVFFSFEDGIYQAITNLYDIILLDISNPRIHDLQIVRDIRKHNSAIPILLITNQSDSVFKHNAFEQGADDYLTKPFDQLELVARINALVRRSNHRSAERTFHLGEFMIDVENHKVFRHGEPLILRRKEFEILVYMVRNAGKPISRETLQSYVWNEEREFLANTIDVHISYLRDKLDKPYGTHCIQTVHGVGYKFVTE